MLQPIFVYDVNAPQQALGRLGRLGEVPLPKVAWLACIAEGWLVEFN